ncbi:hypothetical protein [Tessaracoccus sp. OH4464_COT-324]|uniref:hypothetical protein n=1 Tax=Tessaracoccus sp. OH4464_COT-324 TaxID=2491059 RepID=UPI000F63A518|nr:hypothetical protein [Tessaracoccus sp. OH4464_COT-324]RRD47910.1 hypothetical protein EII42_01295 [Tessaracoccus sp. OH4464_COT-324]
MLITAAGSVPGTDFRGALSTMLEALPERLPLPELPARGPESQIIGRALGLVDGLCFDLQPAGWRLTQHSDASHRRAKSVWRRDLDDLEELLQEFSGVLKVGVAGPWTLSATVERPAGDKLLADHGARREVTGALREAVVELRRELSRRVPLARVEVQLDEPALVGVRLGRIATSSGFSRHRTVGDEELAAALGLAGGDIVHCCADGAWLDIVARARVPEIYPDIRYVQLDQLGEWVESGGRVILGVIETSACRVISRDDVLRQARTVTRELGADDWLTLAPACGMASWRPADVTRQLSILRAAADRDLLT